MDGKFPVSQLITDLCLTTPTGLLNFPYEFITFAIEIQLGPKLIVAYSFSMICEGNILYFVILSFCHVSQFLN